MSLVKDTFRIKEETMNVILAIQEEQHLSSKGKAIDFLAANYNSTPIEERIAKEVTAQLSNHLTRIRLGTNNSDRNSQVIIELLNTILIKEEYANCLSSEEYMSPALADALDIVKKRIERFKQVKDNSKRR
ncbi:hypothetical protein ABC970_22000 [Bacillus licheniformis]|uniref:hypothetical protein n=1 Tax=Bacteria TaxID=2 RepID=UPI00046FD535|nr:MULTISPECIES: hypothetical protein [Bacteria]ASK26298.1 hypothetical protein BSSX_p0107 [Bacillus subtilis]MCA1183066.1 hypothetical protein [Bacillus licheniformis]MCQ5304506.1 hypothetical protein [Bacillus licheniformis]MDM5287337.1 hypothetical protein [Bacillus licheniformis]MDN5389939.1 hypothetical protein [Bacillus sp. LB7]